MRRGGGGFGTHEKQGHEVGIITAAVTFLALALVVRAPKHHPALFERAVIGTMIMIPFTMFVGDHPFTNIWWDIAIIVLGGWASEADERTRR